MTRGEKDRSAKLSSPEPFSTFGDGRKHGSHGITRRRFIKVAGAAGGAALFGLAPGIKLAGAQKPVTIRRAFGGPSPSDIGRMLYLDYMKENVLKQYGKKYTLEMISLRGTPSVVSALTAQEADIGTLAFTTLPFLIIKDAVPGGVSVISDIKYDGYPGYRSIVWVVREDSGINSVKDLKGKKVGINEFAAGVDVGLRVMLKKNGLDPKKDVQIIEIAFPHQGVALREGRLDCAVLLQPFESQEFKKGGIRRLFTLADAIGPSAFIFQTARNKFLKENAEAVRAYLDDYVRALKWYQDPKNREKMIEITAAATKVPKEIYAGYFLLKNDDYRDPNGCIKVQDLQKPIDYMLELGFINKKVDISKYVDLSYLPNPCPA